jgi:putative ABC transport system substrate-binding protein
MKRRQLICALASTLSLRVISAAAQQPEKPRHVGLLMGSTPEVEAPRLVAFRDTLANLGYRDGTQIIIDVRYGEGSRDRIASLARELVVTDPAVIACVSAEAPALQAATRDIPIVFMNAFYDPVAQGLVASLARPGGNITGFSQMSPELDAKRLELLHEIVPALQHVVFLLDPLVPGITERFAAAEAAAKRLDIELRRIEARNPDELTAALAKLPGSPGEAIFVPEHPMLQGSELPRILEFAHAHRLPATAGGLLTVRKGGLFAYTGDMIENARLAAGYVARILKGAKPADLPVQQSTKFLLIINLKTAKELGLTVPPSVIARADEIIE